MTAFIRSTVPKSPLSFAGTQLIVECTFSNYTDETVYGGYGSYDEMCFNFSYVSLIQGEPQQAAQNDP